MIEVPFIVVVNSETKLDTLQFDHIPEQSEIGMGVWAKYTTYSAYVALYEGQVTSQVDVFYAEVNPNWNEELKEQLLATVE
jgi:hypothetical protein